MRRTEHYAGFLTSSAKLTLVLGPQPSATVDTEGDDGDENDEAGPSTSTIPQPPPQPQFFIEAWICTICGFSNPPSANEGKPKCQLCGMLRQDLPVSSRPVLVAPVPVAATPRQHDPGLSKSLPDSPSILSANPGPSLSGTSAAIDGSIACPRCTFLNHATMRICEMCSTPLPQAQGSRFAPSRIQASAPTSSAVSRASTPGIPDSIKISFRKGGDKAFYVSLKKALQGKAWETVVSVSRASQ